MSGRNQPGTARDTQALARSLERTRRDANDQAQADVVIEDPRRLFLRSPNGAYWQVTVDNAGALSATNVGADPL